MSRRRAWHGVPLIAVLLAAGAAAAGCGSDAAHPASARGSADGSLIAAIRLRSGNPPKTDLLLIDPRGHHTRVLVPSDPARSALRIAVSRPAWSPDGRRLAFVGVVGVAGRRAHRERTDLFVVRADGSGLRRVTHLGTAYTPVWSPDGRTIVFSALRRTVCTPGGYVRFEAPLLRVSNAGRHIQSLTHVHVDCDGTNEESLAHSVRGEVDVPGSFSPDGTHLVFAHERVIGLYIESSIDVIRSDGSERRELTSNGSDPAYSPDGRQIAFVSNRDRNGVIRTGSDESDYASELYVMAADGASPHRLTHTSRLSERAPSWSPDSSRIAYARQREPFTTSVFEMNADGSCGSAIAVDPRGDVSYDEPAWRPVDVGSGEGALSC